MRWLIALSLLFGVAGVSLAAFSLFVQVRQQQAVLDRQSRDASRISALQQNAQYSDERRLLEIRALHLRLRSDEFPWKPSAVGKIAVRMTADADVYVHDSDTIVLLCEVKNTSDEPLRLPTPEIMPYA